MPHTSFNSTHGLSVTTPSAAVVLIELLSLSSGGAFTSPGPLENVQQPSPMDC